MRNQEASERSIVESPDGLTPWEVFDLIQSIGVIAEKALGVLLLHPAGGEPAVPKVAPDRCGNTWREEFGDAAEVSVKVSSGSNLSGMGRSAGREQSC